MVFFDLLKHTLGPKISIDLFWHTFDLTYHNSSYIPAFLQQTIKQFSIFPLQNEREMIELPYMWQE